MKISDYKKQQIERRNETIMLIACGLAVGALMIAVVIIGH